jgi:hypothetical protein
MYFMRFWQRTVFLFLNNSIWLVFRTEMYFVLLQVGTKFLYSPLIIWINKKLHAADLTNLIKKDIFGNGRTAVTLRTLVISKRTHFGKILHKGFVMLTGQKMLGRGMFKHWSRIINESIFTSIQEQVSVYWIYQRTRIFFSFSTSSCTIILHFTVRRMKNTPLLLHKSPQYSSSIYCQLYPLYRYLG